MALFNVHFHSDSLMKGCSMNVVLPQQVQSQIGLESRGGRKLYPVLYLLHGCSDDYSVWARRVAVERYASRYNLAIVMPGGDRAYYTDMPSSYKYFTFVAEELPRIIRGFFPVSNERRDTFVAGLSMGGYGALKLALTYPERYAFAGAFSAVADIVKYCTELADEREIREKVAIFGDLGGIAGSNNDLFKLLETAAEAPERPIIRHYCGLSDFLYEHNQNFRRRVEAAGTFDYRYDEWEGAHGWDFWDECLRRMLEELPLEENIRKNQ